MTQRGIAPYTSRDWPALAAFRAGYYAVGARQCERDYVDWMFERNPARGDAATLWLCRRDGAIVGQQAGIPFAFQVGEHTCVGSWAVDLYVESKWQLRGIGPALSAAHAASCDVALALGITPAAQRAYARAGWIDLGRLGAYFRPLDPHGLSEVRPLRTPALRGALRALSPVLIGCDRAALAAARSFDRGLSLVEVPAFDDRADAIWADARRHHPVIARRDLAWLRWRFDMAPIRGSYRRAHLVGRGRTLGYVVFRTARSQGHPLAIIVDYLAAPRHYAALFSLSLALMRRGGAIALVCATLNPQAERVLRRLGFMRKDELGAAQRLMVRPCAQMIDKTPLLADRANWFVTMADSDIDSAFV